MFTSKHSAASRPRRVTELLPAVVLLLIALASTSARADRNVLWKIINEQCMPAFAAGESPKPCARVEIPSDREHGWVLLKDRRGVLQFLLMPSSRIAGIESPALEEANATHYLAQAWRSRDLLDQLHGHPLPRDAVSLTVNSARNRSQDQLHIHISCVRRDVRARLLAAQDEISEAWSPLQGGWMRRAWFVRRIDEAVLARLNPFVDVAEHVPEAAADMGRATIGVVAATFKDGKEGFVLIASLFDQSDSASGSAEDDIQEHSCRILEDIESPWVY